MEETFVRIAYLTCQHRSSAQWHNGSFPFIRTHALMLSIVYRLFNVYAYNKAVRVIPFR